MTALLAPPDEALNVNWASYRPKQLEVRDFFASRAPYERAIVGYGGSYGGGKTTACALMARDIARYYPGCKILVGRENLAMLRETTMEKFFEVTPSFCISEFNKASLTVKFRMPNWPDGIESTILFVSTKNQLKFKSLELLAVILDEVDAIPESTVHILMARLRGELPTGQVPRYLFLACSNPHEGWFNDWFLNGKVKETEYGKPKFILSKANDAGVHESYVSTMRGVLSESDQARLLDADWEAVDGAIFETFKKQRHVISQQALILSGLPIREYNRNGRKWFIPANAKYAFGGLDFARAMKDAHHSAGVLFLALPNNRVMAIDEFMGNGPNVRRAQEVWMRQCQRALGRNGRHQRVQWVADRTQSVGTYYLQQMRDADNEPLFNITENKGSKNSWHNSIHFIRELLDDTDGTPRMLLLDTCPQFADQIGKYRLTRDMQGKYYDRPRGIDDDVYDAGRYALEFFQEWGSDLTRQEREIPRRSSRYREDEDTGYPDFMGPITVAGKRVN